MIDQLTLYVGIVLVLLGAQGVVRSFAAYWVLLRKNGCIEKREEARCEMWRLIYTSAIALGIVLLKSTH